MTMSDPKSPNAATLPKRTLVEEGTRFKGSLTSTCPIVVQGSVEGEVEGPAVTVTATGALAGRITSGSLKSDGKISGSFDVDSAELSGAVENNTVLRATALSVKLTHPTGKLQLAFGPPEGGRRF
jgi:cytoskeletal protein CcmA (bactofilin family)